METRMWGRLAVNRMLEFWAAWGVDGDKHANLLFFMFVLKRDMLIHRWIKFGVSGKTVLESKWEAYEPY